VLWQEEERCTSQSLDCIIHVHNRHFLSLAHSLTQAQVAVSHCKKGKGIIKVNGRPLSLVEVHFVLQLASFDAY
jgi:hypothetical protein